MSATFIFIYILALVAVLLGIAGFIILIYGLIIKKKNMTLYGSIMSFIAVLIIVSGVFWGVRKVGHFAYRNCKEEINFIHKNCGNFGHGCFKMKMNEDMMNDSAMMAGMAGDSGKICIKKIMKCTGNMKSCAAKCKSKCPHQSE